MTRPIVLVLVAIVLVWPIRTLLLRSRWTELTPRAAILLWQGIGVAIGIALLGACFELTCCSSPATRPRRNVTDFTSSIVASHPPQRVSPNELFGLTAGLIITTVLLGSVVVRAVGVSRARARQRLLIDLVGMEIDEMPGALILDHPQATAFSVPGLRPRVVVSSGALNMLANDELTAVLAHERAHLRARHDLVLLPFRSLASALPRCRTLAAVRDNLAVLVEMAADDRALRECEPSALARALCTMASDDSLAVAPGTAALVATRRVQRALGGHRHARLLACASLSSTLGILALPLVALFAPFAGR